MLMVLTGWVMNTHAMQFQNLFDDEPEFLDVDQAFAFDFEQTGDQLLLKWDIADGYYLYKKKFEIVANQAQLSDPSFPHADQVEDEFFGISDVFHKQVTVTYPILNAQADSSIKIRYQGCAEAGLCYPPEVKTVYLSEVIGTGGSEAVTAASEQSTLAQTETAEKTAPKSKQFDLVDRLTSSESLVITLLLFLGLGIGLAFTPCVFPMYPILSSIVIGQGNTLSLKRAFVLSFIYVQGMAITYSLLGLVVASAGVQFQQALQSEYVLGVMIVLFVALAFVMFGAYELQLPSKWQEKLNAVSSKQQGGSLGGVFLMGVISGLVASPCTTAPLTGILLFIAQSGDMFLGFTALYALSLGMGVPLILFGMTGGKLLPKAGNWMNVVKTSFGFMMLVVAMLFVERMFDNKWTQVAWGLLGMSTFTYFYVVNQNTQSSFWKGARAVVIFIGLFFSFTYGYEAFAPKAVNQVSEAHQGQPEFIKVTDLADFEQKLADANAQGHSVMIDLYADWCVACKEFEKYTFSDSAVIEALSNTVWMQIDLTDYSETNNQFQEHFAVLGLPTILFFDEQGNELEQGRITGFLKAEPFAQHVNNILNH